MTTPLIRLHMRIRQRSTQPHIPMIEPTDYSDCYEIILMYADDRSKKLIKIHH